MSTEAEKEERDNLLAAEYALGVLSHEERQAFAARLDQEPHLRELVRKWDEDLVSMADGIAPVTPPPHILTALERRLFNPESAPAASHASRLGWWSSLALWRGLSLASLGGLVVVGSLYLNSPEPIQPVAASTYVSELAGDSQAVRMIALYEPDNGTLKLHRTQGQPAQDRSFELWYIGGDGVPRSLGVLPAEETGVIELTQEARDAMVTATLAISDEPAGGSPTGQPTGDVLATGKLSEI